MGYLNNDGLLYLWEKIKGKFATKADVAADLKEITDSISGLSYGDMLKSVYDTDGDGIVDNAEKVNGLTVQTAVPPNAIFTDTVYTHPSLSATTGVPTANATPGFGGTFNVNQISSNATGHVTANTSRKITIPNTLSNGTSTAGLIKTTSTETSSNGYTACPVIEGVPYYKNTSYSNATQSKPGLMSDSDKTKLDALPTNSALEGLYAKKTELTNLYKYKGSVANESALPTSGQRTGDVYDIQSASSYGGAGMNVAWDGEKWDALGEIFSITSISNADIDTICV